jgi:prepilin-type N-terminal cleavage/methylation domain-containing protein
VKYPITSHNASRGFSLVELMVSITFFGILMLGFLTVFPLGFRTVQKGEKMTVATSLAQDELERLKTLPVNDPDLFPGTHVDAANPLNGVYTRTWTVTSDTPIVGMTTVSMDIAYSDNGIPRNIQVMTYLSR